MLMNVLWEVVICVLRIARTLLEVTHVAVTQDTPSAVMATRVMVRSIV